MMDIVWRVEQKFQIRIAREEIETAFGSGTVGELYTFVLTKMGGTRWPHCLGRPVFGRVRAALASEWNASPAGIAPSSDLVALMPTDRRRAWKRLGHALELPLPALQRPAWLERLARSLIWKGMLFLFPPIAMVLVWWNPLWWAAGAASGLGLGALVLATTLPLAIRPPDSCQTVKGFIRTLLREHYGLLAQREGTWHHAEVWQALRATLVEVLNVQRAAVTPAAHFARDLGAG